MKNILIIDFNNDTNNIFNNYNISRNIANDFIYHNYPLPTTKNEIKYTNGRITNFRDYGIKIIIKSFPQCT